MDRDVAHAAHLCPRNFRMLIDELRRSGSDLAHGFSDDFDISKNRILDLLVPSKSLKVGHGL